MFLKISLTLLVFVNIKCCSTLVCNWNINSTKTCPIGVRHCYTMLSFNGDGGKTVQGCDSDGGCKGDGLFLNCKKGIPKLMNCCSEDHCNHPINIQNDTFDDSSMEICSSSVTYHTNGTILSSSTYCYHNNSINTTNNDNDILKNFNTLKNNISSNFCQTVSLIYKQNNTSKNSLKDFITRLGERILKIDKKTSHQKEVKEPKDTDISSYSLNQTCFQRNISRDVHERSCLSICRNKSCHDLISNSTTEPGITTEASTHSTSSYTSTQSPTTFTTKFSTKSSINASTILNNFSTSPSSEHTNTTKSCGKTDNYHKGTSAGMVISVIMLCVCGVVMLTLVSRKVYEKHFKKRVNYSYSQLNIESAEGGDADDDYLILP